MNRTPAGPREIAVPVSVFASLRAELEKEAGTLPTVHALHNAGYVAGAAAADALARNGGGDPRSLSKDAFWDTVSAFFGTRGWGTLRHARPHRAVGILSSPDWAEAGDGPTDPEASCHFSTGFLSGLLSELAGGPIAVLEVACRTRGGDACRFAFGSEAAIHELYGRLLEGGDLDGALAAL
ncbi:MAG TPA: 4-vinyl reductase [Longimicrobiales bacterium]|nr:4-vinyl reductase [Longimicrobiales bacterium]